MAIGVARRGARRSGERTLRIPPSCSDPVSHACGPHVASFVRRSSVCGPANVRACGRAWRAAQCEASRKKERPAKRRVGTLKKKRKAPCVLRDHRGQWERRARSCMKERIAVCVRWYKEDRGERERRVWYCVHCGTDSARAAEALPCRTRRQCKEVGDRASGSLRATDPLPWSRQWPAPSTVPQQGVPASLGGRTRFHGGLAISQALATHVEGNS